MAGTAHPSYRRVLAPVARAPPRGGAVLLVRAGGRWRRAGGPAAARALGPVPRLPRVTQPRDLQDRITAAREALTENPVWYHTIELAPGVTTPGFVDHRPITPRILPADMRGLRVLEVGTFDGHWSFSMEERGAEVTALDLPDFDATSWPPVHRERLQAEIAERNMELGRGFRLAHELRGSSVTRVTGDVQTLGPGELDDEPFDVVFIGAVLLHLRDPVGALERMAQRTRPGGRLIALETFSLLATVLSPWRAMARFQTLETPFNWWVPNMVALRDWFATAGWVDVRRHGIHKPPAKAEMSDRYVHFSARKPG